MIGFRPEPSADATAQFGSLFPNVAPTGRCVEVPLVAIVGFRDGKLAHENIYWDHASVLKQIGLLTELKQIGLPTDPALPVYAAETARKVLDLQS